MKLYKSVDMSNFFIKEKALPCKKTDNAFRIVICGCFLRELIKPGGDAQDFSSI